MNRNREIVADPILLVLTILMTFLGLVIIFDAGYARSMATGKGPIPAEFVKQGMFVFISLIVFVISIVVPMESWQKWAKPAMFLMMSSLVFVHFFGKVQNGARRWISLGPVDIQPAEFAKVVVILYLAAVFANRKPWPMKAPRTRSFGDWFAKIGAPKIDRMWCGFLVLAAFVLIELEKDLGTAMVVLVTAAALMLLGGISKSSMIAAAAMIVLGVTGLVFKEGYRMDRVNAHLHRWDVRFVDTAGFQTCQSELAMASGGIAGVGIGNGRAKHILPATTTDFVMATVGEELGLIGPLILLGLLGGICWRLWLLAQKSKSKFAALYLSGVAVWFGVQACTNLMMANGTLPAIGIPFPFISSGGSSLVALWLAVGIAQVMHVRGAQMEGEVARRRHRWGNGRARLSRA